MQFGFSYFPYSYSLGHHEAVMSTRRWLCFNSSLILCGHSQPQAQKQFFRSEQLISWDSNGDGNCCIWDSVRCNRSTHYVTVLDLSNLIILASSVLNVSFFQPFGELISLDLSGNDINQLVGIGGYNMLNLTNLEILKFGNNEIEQDELANLVGSLTSLKELSLTANVIDGITEFTGQELGRLKKLETLDLSANHLELHSLSSGLSQWKKLRILDLSQNYILNGFPLLGQELAHLKDLEELNLSGNGIDGSAFVQDLSHLKRLRVLNLGDNYLNGSLTSQGICELVDLEELRLGSNQFSGSIPKCFWNLTSLRVLDLSGNSFTGDLPTLINLPSLQFFSVNGNHFEGRVSLCYLMNHSRLLDNLDLSNNALQVEIGDAFCSSPSQFVDLGLGRCNLSGQSNTFPKFLSNQSSLVHLDLSSNGLIGSLPEWLLLNNPNLQNLNLRNNSVSGSLKLPKQSNLSELFSLDVSINKLKGEIPGDIGMVLSSLVNLNMSGNSLEGQIPNSVGNMTQLGALDLSSNHLVGVVPRKLFSDCNQIQFLVLSNNYLQGEIIPSYMNLSALKVLYLDNNGFGGTIKGSLRISLSLSIFDISNNKATGELPSWIEELDSLTSMSLAKNDFHGNIRSPLCNTSLESIEYLDLSMNRFTGWIPSCDRYSTLMFLHMNGNRLTGKIPYGLTMFWSLVTLDLSNNHLSGGIPQWIDQLSTLVILLLRGNQLGGELPKQLCRLEHVNIINLSSNDISGSIPTCFKDLSFGAPESSTLYDSSVTESFYKNWDDFDAHFKVPTEVYERQEEVEFIVKNRYSSYKGDILSIMSELDLSDNKLAGEIPTELGELGKINAVNLSYNRLFGPIPRSFSKLKSIESLDLSSNNLSGPIPSELVDLHFLGTFNVSYNNLSGQVPETEQFGTFDERNYRGNPFLVWSRLPRSPGMDVTPGVPTGNNSSEQGDSGFDMEVFLWSFGVSAVIIFLAINGVLAINPYWRRAWFAFLDVKVLWWFRP